METNGFDHAVRGGGKYIPRSIIYSLPTFTHTDGDVSPVGSPGFAVNLPQFTRPPYTLRTAQMVVLWFTWQSATSQAPRRAIGFHSVSLEITRGKKT